MALFSDLLRLRSRFSSVALVAGDRDYAGTFVGGGGAFRLALDLARVARRPLRSVASPSYWSCRLSPPWACDLCAASARGGVPRSVRGAKKKRADPGARIGPLVGRAALNHKSRPLYHLQRPGFGPQSQTPHGVTGEEFADKIFDCSEYCTTRSRLLHEAAAASFHTACLPRRRTPRERDPPTPWQTVHVQALPSGHFKPTSANRESSHHSRTTGTGGELYS